MQAGLGVIESVESDGLFALDEEWEVACDIPKYAESIGRGWPHCKGHPAQWVAWFANCCPERPRFMLMCHDCKGAYDRWTAWKAVIDCGWCGTEIGGPITYTELNKGRA